MAGLAATYDEDVGALTRHGWPSYARDGRRGSRAGGWLWRARRAIQGTRRSGVRVATHAIAPAPNIIATQASMASRGATWVVLRSTSGCGYNPNRGSKKSDDSECTTSTPIANHDRTHTDTRTPHQAPEAGGQPRSHPARRAHGLRRPRLSRRHHRGDRRRGRALQRRHLLQLRQQGRTVPG